MGEKENDNIHTLSHNVVYMQILRVLVISI